MKRGLPIFFTALLLSLAIHLLLASNSSSWWSISAPEVPFPIEAHLLSKSPPSPQTTTSPHPAGSRPDPTLRLPPAPAPVEPQAPSISEPDPITKSPVSTPEPTPAPASEPMPSPPLALPPPSPSPPHALRGLPERLSLRYAVQSGEGGFTLGQAVYSWLLRDGRYSLVSVTEAKGIASLFIGGKIVQTSEGRVTPSGLQPEQFWMAKGERRQPPVQFDWAQKRLVLPGGSLDLPALAQDLLSFPFHISMTVREGEGEEWLLPITNGKKLREYGFRVLGHETLPLGEAQIETLHLQGGRTGEGSMDVWLAPARHWLPVRIRTLDQKGKMMVLNLEAID